MIHKSTLLVIDKAQHEREIVHLEGTLTLAKHATRGV
jgi:hypothetical protein